MGQAAMQPPSQATPNVKNAPPKWPAPIEAVLIITVIRIIFNFIPFPFVGSSLAQKIAYAFTALFDVVGIIAQVARKQQLLSVYWLRKLGTIRGKRKDIEIICVSSDYDWAKWIEWVLNKQGYDVMRWHGGKVFERVGSSKVKTQWKMFIHSQVYADDPAWQKYRQRRTVLVEVHPDSSPHPDRSPKNMKVIHLSELEEGMAQDTLLQEVRDKLGLPRRSPDNQPDLCKPAYPRAQWHGPPYRLHSGFQGQQEILDRLHREFIEASERSTPTQPHALTGLAQIGKTRIALEFAARHRSYYDHVFWINAGSNKEIIDGFQLIAAWIRPRSKRNGMEIIKEDGTVVNGVTDEEVEEAVRHWLQENDRVLVIFNIANNFQWEVFVRSLPWEAKSHILLTTCYAFPTSLRDEVPTIPVNNLTLEEGARLLLFHAGKEEENEDWQAEIIPARKIVERIGGFPPALARIGEEIGKSRTTTERYLKDFNEQAVEEILCQQDFSTGKSIHACWEEQFEKLSLGEVAREFLFFCAFFGRQAIPEAVFEREVARLDAELHTTCTLDEVIKALRVYSFVERLDGQITLNPLFQIWLQRRYQIWLQQSNQDLEASMRAMVTRVIQSVAQLLPNADDPAFLRYIEHARACALYIDKYKIYTEEARNIIAKLLDAEQDFLGNEQQTQNLLRIQDDILVCTERQRASAQRSESEP